MNHSHFDDDRPLLNFIRNGKQTPITIKDSFENFFCTGATGSGKSSAIFKLLSTRMLENGYGGLFLTTKTTDKDDYLEYCRQANRLENVVIIEPNGEYFFDVLDYEASANEKSAYTQNVVELLNQVIQSGNQKDNGKSDDPFWEKSLEILLHQLCALCLIAFGKISIKELYDIALSIPKPDDKIERNGKTSFALAFEAAQANIEKQAQDFLKGQTYYFRKKAKDADFFQKNVIDKIPDASKLTSIDQFFIEAYRNLSSKTRSIIDLSLSSFLFSLLQEPIYSLFCSGKTNVTPDMCAEGKIIILNVPIKTHYKAGRDIQTIFKLCFERAMERRDVSQNARPCFLFIDEAQGFITESDTSFLMTARSSRVSSVFISQNLPNLFAAMGGEGSKSENKVYSLLGNFGTKFFCCNTCVQTNRWAADIIGKGYTPNVSVDGRMAGGFSSGRSLSYELEEMVRPEIFSYLKKGGPPVFLVEAYVHLQGKTFDDNKTYRKVTFKQK